MDSLELPRVGSIVRLKSSIFFWIQHFADASPFCNKYRSDRLETLSLNGRNLKNGLFRCKKASWRSGKTTLIPTTVPEPSAISTGISARLRFRAKYFWIFVLNEITKKIIARYFYQGGERSTHSLEKVL